MTIILTALCQIIRSLSTEASFHSDLLNLLCPEKMKDGLSNQGFSLTDFIALRKTTMTKIKYEFMALR